VNVEEEIKFLGRDVLYVVRLLIGFVLVVVGLIGLVFPVAPDWILIAIGILFFDVNGKISGFLVGLLPKSIKLKVKSVVLKMRRKIDKVFETN